MNLICGSPIWGYYVQSPHKPLVFQALRYRRHRATEVLQQSRPKREIKIVHAKQEIQIRLTVGDTRSQKLQRFDACACVVTPLQLALSSACSRSFLCWTGVFGDMLRRSRKARTRSLTVQFTAKGSPRLLRRYNRRSPGREMHFVSWCCCSHLPLRFQNA